jgi:hypothetical protein
MMQKPQIKTNQAPRPGKGDISNFKGSKSANHEDHRQPAFLECSARISRCRAVVLRGFVTIGESDLEKSVPC